VRAHLPHGVQDILQGEAARRRRPEAALRDIFSRWAYHEDIPLIFEYNDNLVVGASPDLRQAMYCFFDREGRTLALRADFTTQVARMVATKLFDQPLPVRCFYAAQSEGDERVVSEIADLAYHALVLLAARELSWTDAEGELARRFG
jgi:ATP phosphoribosyltransferase regulatory subunit